MYIGKSPQTGAYSILDTLTASATASYTLQLNSVNYTPESAQHLILSLNGTIQKPNSSFTCSGSTLTFSEALTSNDSIDFIYALGNVLDIGTPSDSTISTAKLINNSVTGAKFNADVISGQTALTSEPADTDEFLVSDAGVIKRVDYSHIKGGGTHVLLGSTNVTSNVSNVTFQSLFSDTYTNYYLTGRGINKSESSHLHLRFLNGGTTDSGSSYDDVYGVGMRSRSSSTWSDRHNSQAEIQFIESAGINTATFTMWIDTSFRGTSTHDYVNLHGIESHWFDDSNGYITATFGGVYLPNTNVDGIKFITSSGTITSGRFSLYGVKHA